jgi:hypothetical protein
MYFSLAFRYPVFQLWWEEAAILRLITIKYSLVLKNWIPHSAPNMDMGPEAIRPLHNNFFHFAPF